MSEAGDKTDETSAMERLGSHREDVEKLDAMYLGSEVTQGSCMLVLTPKAVVM